MAERPACRTAVAFLRANYRGVLAPLTGQDAAALEAFAHLVAAYGRADNPGRAHLLVAMRHTVLAMQPTCREVARLSIPAMLDWSDEARIWLRIRPDAVPTDEQTDDPAPPAPPRPTLTVVRGDKE